MKTIGAALIAAALVTLSAGVAMAAKPVPTGTIEFASVDPVIGGEVTFTATDDNLRGNQWAMVYLVCEVDGTVVYGQLAKPDETFILGGGSSDWITPGDPNYLAPATCKASLRVYPDGVVILAETETFGVAG